MNYWIKNLNTQDHSGLLRSTPERPWALLSAHEHSCALVSMVPRRYECLMSHDTMLINAYLHSWVLQGPCSWLLLMSAKEGPWVIIRANDCSWCHSHVCSWLLLSIHEHSWALISSHEHSRAWCHAMVPIALMTSREHWWARHHGTITTHSALAQYLSVPMSAHKCSWVLLRIVELPWVFKFLIQ